MYLKEWNSQFTSQDDVDDAILSWAKDLQKFSAKDFEQARINLLKSGDDRIPKLPKFYRLCLDEAEKNKLAAPLFVSEKSSLKSNLKPDLSEVKKTLSVVKKPEKKVDCRTDEQIQIDFDTEKARQLQALADRGVIL